jgi:hypothetical protein
VGNRIDDLVNRRMRTPPPPPPSGQTPSTENTSAPPGGGSTSRSSAGQSATPPSAGKNSGEVRFSPSEIKQLGLNVERELDAIFKQARYKLNGAPRDLEPSAFTTFGYAFAMVHTEVIEYADQDLITKSKLAMDIGDRLQKTAITQDEGERKSTIKGGD